MLCEECQTPICSKCATQVNHRGHKFIDLEKVYANKMVLCLEEISKVDKYFLLTSQDLQKEIKRDTTEIKTIMDSLRTAMKGDGESLKSLVDAVVSENIQQVDNIEQSLLDKLQSQDTTYDDYISYLHDHLKELYGYLSSSKLSKIILKLSEKFPDIRPIPQTAKLVTPAFTAGQCSKDDVAKLLGKINIKDTKAEARKIKPMEIVSPSTSVKSTSKQKERDSYKKSDVKQKLSLSPSVTEVRTFNVPGVDGTYHMSLGKSGRFWASDYKGNLVQSDLHRTQLQAMQTSGEGGYHTVTQDGELIFTDRRSKVIKKITLDNKMTEFIKTGDWEPISIHSSHINGDILVGMRKDGEPLRRLMRMFMIGEVKVTRYNKIGEELQNIQRDSKEQGLYSTPHYITENINGDICVSDYNKCAVVGVNKSGHHRFSYTGQGPWFWPFGICTDAFGHILVCNGYNPSDGVHLLDQDGQFLSLLLTPQGVLSLFFKQWASIPSSVCVDDDNNLYVGQHRNNTVTVYKFHQR
jgi:hypothetical protein